MGAEHSQPRERRPRKNEPKEPEIVRINRSDPDLPEEYRMVQISDDVIQRLQGLVDEENAAELSERLAQQVEENSRLRQKMEEIEQKHKGEMLAAAVTAATTAAATAVTAPVPTEEDINEQQRIFNETANRVEKVFFSRQHQNACAENEKEIIECLSANPKQVLRCQHILNGYKECSDKFKSKLVQDQLGQSQ